MFAGKVHNLRHLGFGDLIGEDPALADPVLVQQSEHARHGVGLVGVGDLAAGDRLLHDLRDLAAPTENETASFGPDAVTNNTPDTVAPSVSSAAMATGMASAASRRERG